MMAILSYYKGTKKFGHYFKKRLEFLQNSSLQERERVTHRELDEFLRWLAFEHPYYDVNFADQLQQLPIMDKSIALANYEQIVSGSKYTQNHTSGTSGLPLRMLYSKEAWQGEYAIVWYYRGLRKVRLKDPVATFAGHNVTRISAKKPPYWIYDPYLNNLFFSSYHLSHSTLRAYVDQLNRFQPVFIHGYPSSIYLIARHIMMKGRKLKFIPRAIATSSETLLEYQAAAIKEAFQCPVDTFYGNTEGCGIAFTCINGVLHTQPWSSAIRIINNTGADAAPGEEGTLVATNFLNRVFPLVNYNTRDRVRVRENQDCSCGLGGILIDELQGRQEDYVITPEGRYIGRLDHLFKDASFIKNAQIEQKEAAELIIRIVKDAGYNLEVEKTIREEAINRVGKTIRLKFEYVDNIPMATSGKFPFVIQKLKNALTANVDLNTTG
jgi:phenylacetate-CoA ligase